MARPRKNNADYFSHDSDMRNHRKVKALRNKYKGNGYACFGMLLELLTDSENLIIEYNEIELELISGDFDIPVDELKDILEFMNKIDLIEIEGERLHCPELTKRLQPVFDKRKSAKLSYQIRKQKESVVSETETIRNIQKLKDEEYLKSVQSSLNTQFIKISLTELKHDAEIFIDEKIAIQDINKPFHEYANHFLNKIKKKFKAEPEKKPSYTKPKNLIE